MVELVLLVSVVEASGQKAPSAKPFERLDGCVLEPDEWIDGDSFRVRLPGGRLETFRRSHPVVIRTYDGTGNVIETHEHAGQFERVVSAPA